MDSIKYVSRLDDWILTTIDLHFYLVTNKSCVQNHPLRHGLRSSIPEVEQITSSGLGTCSLPVQHGDRGNCGDCDWAEKN